MLDLGEFLADTKARFGGRFASMMQKIQDSVNQLATLTGADPTQYTSAPSAPNTINVVAGTDHVHVTLTDNTKRPRAQNYFIEWSVNDPNFLAPHMEHLGASRGKVLPLAAMDTSSNVYNYYFRGYAHTLGGKTASKKITFGGNMTPMPVTLSGSSQLDYLPSTGGGTAPSNGQRPGQGFGTPQFSETGGPSAP